MELQDIYNEKKERTGKVIVKGTPREPGERILCAGCWIVNHKGEFFITKRSPDKKFMPNLWENSSGHAIAGEDGWQTALREMFEETGIRAERSDLILLSERMEEQIFTEDYVIVKDFPLSSVVLQEGETCAAAWVSEERWEEMLASGEIAPSVRKKLGEHKERLLEIVHSLKNQ